MRHAGIATKIAGALALVLVLMVVWAGRSIWGVGSIVGNAADVIDGTLLRAEMSQTEVDHLALAGLATSLVTDGNVHDIEVEVVHDQCGFGAWLKSDERSRTESYMPALAATIGSLEEPHRLLYESARSITGIYEPANPAEGVLFAMPRSIPCIGHRESSTRSCRKTRLRSRAFRVIPAVANSDTGSSPTIPKKEWRPMMNSGRHGHASRSIIGNARKFHRDQIQGRTW